MMRDTRHDAPRMKPFDTPIPTEAMEVIADVILAAQARDPERPSYREMTLTKKSKRASLAELYYGVLSAARQSPADAASDDVGLTQQESMAWKMYLGGHVASEIAQVLGVTRPTAVSSVRRAAGKLTSREDGQGGLREVYRHEVRRTFYRKPSHCSEEACKRLGYCKYPGRLG